MESTNNINTVNTSLSSCNDLKSNLEITRDLLTKATTELNVLRANQKDNKVVLVQQIERDRYGNDTSKQMLKLDIEDPNTSSAILDIISKVKTSELQQKVTEGEDKIKQLKSQLESAQEEQKNLEKFYLHRTRDDEDRKKEEIRKLRKGYEESIDSLEEDKKTLAKALTDLKKDKLQEQIELAREQELTDLREKLDALEEFQSLVVNEKNPFKLRNFIANKLNADRFAINHPWFNKMRSNINSAVDRVESFTRMIANVGKLPEKSTCKSASNGCYSSNQPVYVTNNYYSDSEYLND
jgi:DNA repair exonuclease SbcCD ATPase subunit